MVYTIRVSLEGYNALTDTNPDHYALVADENWVLIKEKARGSGALAYGSNVDIAHGLGYIPMVLLWGEDTSGNIVLQGMHNDFSAQEEWFVQIDSTNVNVTQVVGTGDYDYHYYIFHDKLE